ncbi:18075_t:CDS:2 [Entrophospora sp. SA101]|nr:18075_t:CDS:2 [Entrophospora sp. SA101]
MPITKKEDDDNNFLEYKKGEILAGISKTSAHHTYKKDLQLILESNPPENVSITIMKQLTQKIQESDEVKNFWKLVSAEKKYTEQLNTIRANAPFESDVLKVCGKRCYEEIDNVIQLEIKRRELEANISDNEYPSTPTPIGATMNNECEARSNSIEENEEYNNTNKDKEETEQIKFWTGNNKESNNQAKIIPRFKSLKSSVNTRFPDIAKEIEIHAQEQTKLTSLGPTLTKWLQEVLLSSTPEKLGECLIQLLQGEHITDREKKLHDIFETTLKKFHTMIKYNPKHTLPRHNSERKFFVERVVTPFKLVEYVFGNVTTYWIEKTIMSTKAMEFIDDPTGELTSKKADALATDLTYNLDVMNMEASGGPLQQDRKHTLNDSGKISNTGVDILLMSL